MSQDAIVKAFSLQQDIKSILSYQLRRYSISLQIVPIVMGTLYLISWASVSISKA